MKKYKTKTVKTTNQTKNSQQQNHPKEVSKSVASLVVVSNIFLFSPRKLGKISSQFDGSHIFQTGGEKTHQPGMFDKRG